MHSRDDVLIAEKAWREGIDDLYAMAINHAPAFRLTGDKLVISGHELFEEYKTRKQRCKDLQQKFDNAGPIYSENGMRNWARWVFLRAMWATNEVLMLRNLTSSTMTLSRNLLAAILFSRVSPPPRVIPRPNQRIGLCPIRRSHCQLVRNPTRSADPSSGAT